MKMEVNQDTLKKFESLLDKAMGDDYTLRSFCDKCEVKSLYVENFLRGINPNVPNKRLLTKIAQNSNGRVTYEELANLFYTEDETVSFEDFDLSSIRKGDVLWADLGKGEGSEQSGLRLVVVIQNDMGNKYSPTIIIACITGQINKAKLPTHVELSKELSKDIGISKDSVVLLEQIRTIDKKARVKGYAGHCDFQTAKKIAFALKKSLGMDTWLDELVMYAEQQECNIVKEEDNDVISNFLNLMPQVKNKFFDLFRKNRSFARN